MRKPLGDVRPTVNPVFTPVEVSPNRIEFRVGPFVGPTHSLADRDGDGELGRLLGYLDGERTVSEILAAFDDDAAAELRPVVASLLEKNALVDVSDREPDAVWAYSTVSDTVSGDELDRLRSATVGVVTRGRIGKMVAADLVEAGVDEVSVLDFGDERDSVLELPDDLAFDADDADDAESNGDNADDADDAESGADDAPEPGDVEALVSAVDYVVYADDAASMDVARRVNERAVATETPVSVGQLLGVEAVVGPTIVPGQGPCLECLLERWTMRLADDDGYRAYLDADSTDGTARSESTDQRAHLPSHARLVAGFLSKEVLTQLLTGHGYTVGRTFDVDLVSMRFQTNEIMKLPRCDVCGPPTDARRADDYQRVVDPELLDTPTDDWRGFGDGRGMGGDGRGTGGDGGRGTGGDGGRGTGGDGAW